MTLAACAAILSCQPGVPVETEELASGVYHHTVSLIDGPWAIHVVEVDLRQAWEEGVRLRTVRASGPTGLERTSAMARGAVAAVNGDFFHNSDPVRTLGLQISEGGLVENPRRGSAFAVSDVGHPIIAVFNLRAGLITSSGESLPIDVINRDPGRETLSYYNRYALGRRDSVRAAVGFHLQSLGAASVINDTVEARVLQVRRLAWPLRLGADEWFVAAGNEYANIEDVAAGDTVGLYCLLPPVADPLVEAIGGGPRIIRDGEVSVEHQQENLGSQFALERHPRTAVGYSHNGRSLFLVTVDGHQPGYSVGMSLAELAEFMARTLTSFSRTGEGAYQALNLDGGKSTTMVVKEQVVNRPSYPTGEQAVANALTVVAAKAKGSQDAAL
jgi:exopolysaccharide biosynthesis protein